MDLDTVSALLPADRVRWQPGDAWLAGGTWLFSEPQPQLTRLLDLHAFGWPSITESEDGLELAATCTIAELARWRPRPDWPGGRLALLCCQALLGSFAVWNSATVGGNICLSLPAGPMTSFAAGLDARARLIDSAGGSSELPVADFVTGNGRNTLAPGQLLRAVFVPAQALRQQVAFRQLSLTEHGRSAVLVTGRRTADGATVLTVTAAVDHPVQLRFTRPPTLRSALVELDARAVPWFDDVHGDPRWRAAMTRRLIGEVLDELDRP